MTTPAHPAVAAPLPLGAQVNIPPRRMDFEFSFVRKQYYFDNDAFKTSFWGALSALFPAGESFFVESVRHYRDQITDPVLRAQIAGFIGQEAMHSKEHTAFNEAFEKAGYPMKALERSVERLLGLLQKTTPAIGQLGVTVCLEHYTAVIAEYALRSEDMQRRADPELLKLWLWHALEESEHKTVAFDVFQRVGGSPARLRVQMVLTTVIFFAMIGWFHMRILAADGQLLEVRKNWQGFRYFWGKGGMFPAIAPRLLDFFRPGFHPLQHDTEALLDEWRERLFGANGLLKDQLRPPAQPRKA